MVTFLFGVKMAITNYTELKTAVANWLHRSGMDSIIPDLITLGEATINRRLKLRQMENTSTTTTSTSNRFVALPDGFLELIDVAIYIDGVPQTLTQLPLSKINDSDLSTTGQPEFYAISSNLIFDKVSDQAYTVEIRYLKKLDIATDETNYVLTNYPDIYLYSALMASAPYVKNDERLGMWVSLLDDAVKSANRVDGRSKGKSMLVTDFPMSAGGYNIYGDV